MSDQTPVQTSDVTVMASDGFKLAATLFEPASSNGRVVLINSAMAVRRGFYAKYAAFLARKGFTVLTYDYRGIGDSRPATLRGYKAYLWEWSAKDMAAAIGWIREHYPNDKLLAVGHSVGGQIVGLTAENQHIAGLFGVAVQSAYWRLWSGLERWRVFFVLYIVFPLMTRLWGYFPEKMGMGAEGVPAGVALDWAHAGQCRKYLLDFYNTPELDHYASLTASFLDYSFSDDAYASYAAVEELLTFYPNARKTHKHIQPSDVGAEAIGHFGFFRSKFETTLWAESAAWLMEQ